MGSGPYDRHALRIASLAVGTYTRKCDGLDSVLLYGRSQACKGVFQGAKSGWSDRETTWLNSLPPILTYAMGIQPSLDYDPWL